MQILYALQRMDSRLFLALFRQGERRMVRPGAVAVSRSADGYLHALVPLSLLLLGVPGATSVIALVAVALAIERPLYWVLKNSFGRKRPQEYWPGFTSLVVAGDRFSFPSGHTSAAFLLATALAIVYREPLYPVYCWAGAVAVSRVLLGVHFPGDTVAGAVLGSALAVVAASCLGMI